jgi:hypothetical protein
VSAVRNVHWVFGLLAAVAALAAGIAWYWAARHPVGKSGLPFYASDEILQQVAAHGKKIDRGSMLNRWAASLAALSAAFALLAFVTDR